ncbi:DnaJ sub C member 9 [Phlyctochytrium planicorne]|nr:DnaJ sub C member 9 [Phlyctochytrium planicorne]
MAKGKRKEDEEEEVLEEIDKTPDLYAIFGIAKTAKPQEIKKAYHKVCLLSPIPIVLLTKILVKLCLQYHPDKLASLITDEEKAEATQKFQDIAKYYEVLSDEKKRARYDETGVIDESSNESRFEGLRPEGGWDKYFRDLWGGIVTKDSIDEFALKYKGTLTNRRPNIDQLAGSLEERKDLLDAYKSSKGSMDSVLESVPLSSYEDEERFREIVSNAIDLDEVPKYKKFLVVDEAATLRRKKKAEKEAKEAEKAAAKDQKKGMDDLQALIKGKKQDPFGGLIAKLEREEEERRAKGGKGKASKKAAKADEVMPAEPSEEEFQKLQAKLFGDKIGKENKVDEESGRRRKAAEILESPKNSKKGKSAKGK